MLLRVTKYSRWFFILALFAVAQRFALPLAFAGEETATAAEPSPSRHLRRFERSIARVQPYLVRYGYAASCVAVMVEGMGIPTPGQTLLMASALEAAVGKMNIALLLLLVATSATVGNSIGYALGRWGGRAVLERLKLNRERQQYFDELIKRRGGIVILFARFLDGLRQLNGIVAGLLRMPWWSFTFYNVAGAIIWTCTWGLATYYLRRDVRHIAAFFHRHGRLLYVLCALAVIALLIYLLRRKSANTAEQHS